MSTEVKLVCDRCSLVSTLSETQRREYLDQYEAYGLRSVSDLLAERADRDALEKDVIALRFELARRDALIADLRANADDRREQVKEHVVAVAGYKAALDSQHTRLQAALAKSEQRREALLLGINNWPHSNKGDHSDVVEVMTAMGDAVSQGAPSATVMNPDNANGAADQNAFAEPLPEPIKAKLSLNSFLKYQTKAEASEAARAVATSMYDEAMDKLASSQAAYARLVEQNDAANRIIRDDFNATLKAENATLRAEVGRLAREIHEVRASRAEQAETARDKWKNDADTLTAELREAKAAHSRTGHDYQLANDKGGCLLAENAKLREALQAAVTWADWKNNGHQVEPIPFPWTACEALGVKPGGA